MRLQAAATAIVLALGLSAATAGGQDAAPPVQLPTLVKTPAPPSDVLIHSPLVACNTDAARTPERVRIATWNIRAALSAPVDAIAGELATMQADVISLQEVDYFTRRSGYVDEAAALAAALGFNYAFAASIKWDEGDYGLAVFSKWPLTDVRRHRLDYSTATEPRIVLEATVCVDGRLLHILNHHADGWAGSREVGFEELKRILETRRGRGFLVMGDFNELADQQGVKGLIDFGLVDLGAELGPRVENRRRIDYLLADPFVARLATPARVWPTDKSDHHAMLTDLEW